MRTQKRSVFKTVCLSLTGLSMVMMSPSAFSESLFRAGIAYQTTQPYTPRSLYAIPRPATVGDMVTININEITRVAVQSKSTLSRDQQVEENNTKFFSRIIGKITGVKELFPSVDGVKNQNSVASTGKTERTYTYQDSISCQVVQVLPNGNLVVQGRKTIMATQERQDLYVSGIVNPYYLDGNNTIPSGQVANLQMNVAGRGAVSRQDGEGVLGKYLQLFN